ncbi:tetratricopeptide repeat protein [Lysobacter sp. A6]|uniref:Tetratricopeptide repeat protein n=1 Tax=Noviluteimonas lactosilytica TaxID=2888523 RepID=A0ABS8JG06_9GAMM|nr:tetratricopeptide repeat protein [Lysobacter lactosilyticus]MCC8362492.1 tetratricopeptide repeat protein [Lysobacter lactosilyticus]
MPQRFRRLQDHWAPLAFAAVLLLALLAWWPGVSGGFLFDDFVNLPALGGMGAIDNAPAFWRYITSGTADPTGRPLSLLSFLVDANNWPADPAPFLRTNVLLHLLNGALLFVLLRQLGRRLDGPSSRADAAAVVGAGAWLLHPLFVSTTLYIVQREAMLPATFTLLGLIAWVHGRARFAMSPNAGIAWMVGGLGLCTLLAVLSKANGALLPVLAWVIDAVVLRPGDAAGIREDRRLRAVRGVLLIAPSVLLFAWLALQLRHLHHDFGIREWTIAERLLTQPRVLVDYLQALVVPRVLTTGLYNDGYVVSTGLMSPASTLPALLAIVALIVAGFALRRRAPALACAMLFYFAGHLIESTVLPLELYFEHRNYVPALLLGWPLARAIVGLRLNKDARAALCAVLLLMLAATTWQRASLWTQQDKMAYLWADRNPDSSRAQATAALFEMRTLPPLAVMRLSPLVQANPDDLQLALNLASARCAAGGLGPRDVDAVAYALRHATHGDQLVYRWLGEALGLAQAGSCGGVDVATVARWIDATRTNPTISQIAGRQQDLHSLAGQVALAQGKPQVALDEFDAALTASPSPQAALQQAGMLASAGCFEQAIAHLDRAPMRPASDASSPWNMRRAHDWVMQRQGFYEHERTTLRAIIAEDLRTQGQGKCGA